MRAAAPRVFQAHRKRQAPAIPEGHLRCLGARPTGPRTGAEPRLDSGAARTFPTVPPAARPQGRNAAPWEHRAGPPAQVRRRAARFAAPLPWPLVRERL